MKCWIAVVACAWAIAAASAAEPVTTHVSGTVLDDATGAPIEGARVTVFAVPDDRSAPSVDDQIARGDARSDEAGRFDVSFTTAWTGHGRLTVVAGARGHAEFRPRGGMQAPAPPYEPAFGAGTRVALSPRLVRGPTLAGTVVDEAGRPVAGVRISLAFAGRHWCSALQLAPRPSHWPEDVVSDERGRWELLSLPLDQKLDGAHVDGRFSLLVLHDDFVPVVVHDVDELPARDDVIEIATTLHSGRSVEGRVVDPAGRPVANAAIVAMASLRPGEAPCLQLMKRISANADGTFRIRGLDDHPWRLDATGGSFGPSYPVTVAPASTGALRLDVQDGLELTGHLRDDSGKPLAGIELVLRVQSGDFRQVRTAADGSFRFANLPRCRAWLFGNDLFGRNVFVPGPPIEVSLPARRAVYVTLTRAEDGRPVTAPATLFVRGLDLSWSVPLTRADGRIDAGRLAPGKWELYADVTGRALARKTVTVSANSRDPLDVSLEVPHGFTLRGQVRDRDGRPIQGAHVWTAGEIFETRHALTDGAGIYELRGLGVTQTPIGSAFAVMAEAPGYAPWDDVEIFFRMNLDRRLDITLDRGATVRGRITKADGTPAANIDVSISAERRFLMVRYEPPVIVPATTTDADGRYVLEHVPTGKVTVLADTKRKELTLASGADVTLDWKF